MTVSEIEALCESRGLPYKAEFMEMLSDEELQAGYMKFNIPDVDSLYDGNGEGVWGWMTPEDKEKYNDDTFFGELPAVLLNTPINYYGILWWGCEVVVQCRGNERPVLSPEWVKDKIFATHWFHTKDE